MTSLLATFASQPKVKTINLNPYSNQKNYNLSLYPSEFKAFDVERSKWSAVISKQRSIICFWLKASTYFGYKAMSLHNLYRISLCQLERQHLMILVWSSFSAISPIAKPFFPSQEYPCNFLDLHHQWTKVWSTTPPLQFPTFQFLHSILMSL